MARGRDATDVALTTSFGAAKLCGFKVWTEECAEAQIDQPEAVFAAAPAAMPLAPAAAVPPAPAPLTTTPTPPPPIMPVAA